MIDQARVRAKQLVEVCAVLRQKDKPCYKSTISHGVFRRLAAIFQTVIHMQTSDAVASEIGLSRAMSVARS